MEHNISKDPKIEEWNHIEYWNERVVKIPAKNVNLGDTYMIYEVYYDSNDMPVAWCETGTPRGDSILDLIEEIKHIQQCINKPVLIEINNRLIEDKL
jgi:hypothetical protein